MRVACLVLLLLSAGGTPGPSSRCGLLLAQATAGPAEDSVRAAPARPDPVAAGFQLLLANAVPAAYNRFIKNEPWARIGPRSWARNLRSGFEWDDDHFAANQFAHPLHGSQYFAAARANGFGFWPAVPFAFGGSLMWEFLGETHPASINDWVNTSLGGIALGEVTWRVSRLLLAHPSHGLGRRWRTLAALTVNPAAGLNHLSGEDPWGRFEPPSPGYRFTAEGGFRSVLNDAGDAPPEQATQGFSRLGFEYGSPYQSAARRAFETFELVAEVASGDRGVLSQLRARGLLAATPLWQVRGAEFRLGGFLQYDYLSNRAFQLGAQSLQGSILGSVPVRRGTHLRLEAGPGAVLLGATPNDLVIEASGRRDYDYGSGWGVSAAGSLGSRDHAWLEASWSRLWLYTLDGTDSRHRLRIVQVSGEAPLIAGAGAGVGLEVYSRASSQTGALDSRQRASRTRFFLSWSLRRLQ